MSTLLRKPMKLVCPRCGKTRELKHTPRGKNQMCQPCATTVFDKRRRLTARFRDDDENIEQKLASLESQ